MKRLYLGIGTPFHSGKRIFVPSILFVVYSAKQHSLRALICSAFLIGEVWTTERLVSLLLQLDLSPPIPELNPITTRTSGHRPRILEAVFYQIQLVPPLPRKKGGNPLKWNPRGPLDSILARLHKWFEYCENTFSFCLISNHLTLSVLSSVEFLISPSFSP